jgi:hypothetical protein
VAAYHVYELRQEAIHKRQVAVARPSKRSSDPRGSFLGSEAVLEEGALGPFFLGKAAGHRTAGTVPRGRSGATPGRDKETKHPGGRLR